ncbi:hypothetical protein TIFTF001_038246 [Ficus carica]|uniref:Retrotransposon gag domain-containing protein n=1 Tax=Ficus carica TaxID=3494 RepID=A0AA88E8F9_FICCA|nr:hypothetical protein TIFTF001_038243 [Ficus carica]GMN69193.1 hypothetical protein TIFTF001_038246 [Ficus carica]
MVSPRDVAARVAPDMGTAAKIANLERNITPPPQLVPQAPFAVESTIPQALAVPPVQSQQVINQEPLYEHFRRIKPPEFKGSIDPLEAEDWLISLQVILNFMNLTEQEKEGFVEEFKKQFCDQMAMKAQHNEFDDLKQGDMTITEACRKFD